MAQNKNHPAPPTSLVCAWCPEGPAQPRVARAREGRVPRCLLWGPRPGSGQSFTTGCLLTWEPSVTALQTNPGHSTSRPVHSGRLALSLRVLSPAPSAILVPPGSRETCSCTQGWACLSGLYPDCHLYLAYPRDRDAAECPQHVGLHSRWRLKHEDAARAEQVHGHLRKTWLPSPLVPRAP